MLGQTRPGIAWLKSFGSSLAIAVLYIGTLELMSRVYLHDGNEKMNPNFVVELHGWIKDMVTLPALCRWDCLWYVNMATEGYPGTVGVSTHNTAFFPLFAVVMRGVMALFGIPAAYAAVWITRVCLPFTLTLIRDFVRLSGGNEETAWAAVAAMLFAPEAYDMVSGLADGFFLFLTLLTVVLVKRGRPYWAFVPAMAAGLTRVHAFAFVIALVVLGIEERKKRHPEWTWLTSLVPAVGCVGGVLTLMAYFQHKTGDPLAFIHAQSYFGKSTLNPINTLKEIPFYWNLFPPTNQGDLLDWVRLPVATIVAGSTLYFFAQRRWFECAYTAALNGMLLLSTYWGVTRYMIMIFPVFLAVTSLRRFKPAWYGYLFFGAIYQSHNLLQFVMLRRPE